MNPWLTEFMALLQFLFKAPEVNQLLYIRAGAALLVFLITLHISGWALHVGYATWPRTVFSTVVLVGLPIGLTLAFQILARAQMPPTLPVPWVLGAMLVILILGVILPLLSLLLKTGFFQLLAMIAFSAIAAFVAALLVLFMAGAIQRGAKDFDKAGQHRDAIDSATSEAPAGKAAAP